MLDQEQDAQLLTVAVSSNETSDNSASNLVLFPFALAEMHSILYAHLTVLCGAVMSLSSTVIE